MKITPEHLAIMKQAIIPMDTEEKRAIYKAAGLSDKRYQWDLLRQAGLIPFVCDTLYRYSHDSHIDTALRSIVKPL